MHFDVVRQQYNNKTRQPMTQQQLHQHTSRIHQQKRKHHNNNITPTQQELHQNTSRMHQQKPTATHQQHNTTQHNNNTTQVDVS